MSESCLKDLILTATIITGGCIGAYALGNMLDLMWWFIVTPSCLVMGASFHFLEDKLIEKYYR